MSDWLAVIGVISTAAVSILSVYLPHRYEQKWRKEDRLNAETKRMDDTTLGLLRELSNFRHWAFESLQKIAGDRSVQHLYTDLQVAEFAWERVIWPRLDVQDRSRVEGIRSRLERVHTPDDLTRGPDDSDVPELAEKILSLSRVAIGDRRST